MFKHTVLFIALANVRTATSSVVHPQQTLQQQQQQQQHQQPLETQPATHTSKEIRTRITVVAAAAGALSLQVKLWRGFQQGARVMINPGGTTEEENTLVG